MKPSEVLIREAILTLCRDRGPGKTMCPSEAARRLDAERWRDLMPAVRRVATALSHEGLIEVTQKGTPV